MFKDTELANIRGAYAYLGIEALTTQQELMVLTYMRTTNMAMAARAAGVAPSTARKLLKEDPRVPVLMEFFRAQMFTDTMVTMEMLNTMALEAHRKSSNATEELKAVETLAKLNSMGGFAPAPILRAREEASRERDITPKSAKELERMSEGKLMELAGLDGLSNSLDPIPIEDNPIPIEDETPHVNKQAQEAMRIAMEFETLTPEERRGEVLPDVNILENIDDAVISEP